MSVSELEADRIVPVESNRMGVPECCDAREGIGKERVQAHNQACFSMHRKPGIQQTRFPASSVVGTDKWSAEGVVERGSGQEQKSNWCTTLPESRTKPWGFGLGFAR